MSSITQKSSFGAAQIILFFSIAILVILVAFPVLLILFNAFWVNGELWRSAWRDTKIVRQ